MSVAHAFVSPFDANASAISETIAEKYLEKTTRLVAISLKERGLAELGARVSEIARLEHSCWRPEVGLASTANRHGNPGLAALQLALVSDTACAHMRAHVEGRGHILVDGWLLPVVGDTEVRRAGDELTISCGSDRYDFRRGVEGLFCPDESLAMSCDVHGLDCARPRYIAVSGISTVSDIFGWPQNRGFREKIKGARSDTTVRAIETLSAAVDVLRQRSPQYTSWLDSVVDGILLTSNAAFGAAGSPNLPGLVALSPLDSELDYIEVLLGQACHQHLFQLSLLSSVTQTGSEEIHYVASRRTYVTTRKVVAAAHAHLNAILVLRELSSVPQYAETVADRISRRLLQLHVHCMPTLVQSREFTELGHAFVSKLCELSNKQ